MTFEAETVNLSNEADNIEETTETKKTANRKQVLMSDGTTVTFSEKQAIKTVVDAAVQTIKFYIVSGQVVVWNFNEIPTFQSVVSLPLLYQQMIIAAATARVKNNVATVKVIDTKNVVVGKNEDGSDIVEEQEYFALYEAILANIAIINSGTFNVRGTSEVDDFTLSLDEVAFALYSVLTNNIESWKDLVDTSIISEIKEAWNSLSQTDRKPIRKNPNFKMIKSAVEGYYEGVESAKAVLKALVKGVKFPESIV